jgi:hypothetical protein
MNEGCSVTVSDAIAQTPAVYQPTPAEQRAFAEMQARLVALLLRFDEVGFAQRYGQRDGQAPDAELAALRPYRDMAALVLLRDELFDDILPRIVRRLSFESPRTTVVEEPPPRGRVDWERTLDATWASAPGEPPLELHTRQRRRDFATPENLLAVAVLLEYRADILRLLWDEQLIAQSDALRHPLNAMVDQCERELAFPQFAGIRAAAEQLLDAGEIEELIDRVQERSIPGGNSGYDDLIAWRQHLRTLPLLQRDPQAPTATTLGADPQRDNYLYQLWIFYELADLLRARGAMQPEDLSLQPMRLRFLWQGCAYELQHDQEVLDQVAIWAAQPAAPYRVPRVRPDFYLWRRAPPRQEVRDKGSLVWREPGVVWDAKYYRERESPNAPSSPIKRMVADLNLLGEPHGVLLFAFLTDGQEGAGGYGLNPDRTRNQVLAPDQSVIVQPLTPSLPGEQGAVTVKLMQLLDTAHMRLATPTLPRCEGVFLDAFSASQQAALRSRDGSLLGDADEILVCPKPHIGPWRVDLVSRSLHCCQDGRLCHILGQPGARKPVRPPRSAEELLKELQQLFDSRDPDSLDEESIDAVARRIEDLTRQFARITGALKNLNAYEKQLGDAGFDRTLTVLGAAERESLALAIYLRDQLDAVNAPDYSAPIIHVARALERELQRRILAIPGVSASNFPFSKPTLGSLAGVRSKNPALWATIRMHVASVWDGKVDPEDPAFTVNLDHFVDQLDPVVKVRNRAAHTTPVPRDQYRHIFRHVCNAGPLRVGVLNALLTAWPGS